MRSKLKVLILILTRILTADIYVAFEEADPIFELSNQCGKEVMEAVDGPDAADTCACCNKPQPKMKNW